MTIAYILVGFYCFKWLKDGTRNVRIATLLFLGGGILLGAAALDYRDYRLDGYFRPRAQLVHSYFENNAGTNAACSSYYFTAVGHLDYGMDLCEPLYMQAVGPTRFYAEKFIDRALVVYQAPGYTLIIYDLAILSLVLHR